MNELAPPPTRATRVEAPPAVLAAADIAKSYRRKTHNVPVLRGVDLRVERGEFLAIVGASGSGKSTLLHVLGLLDAPDQGRIQYEGQRIDNLSTKRRDALRNGAFGMIFQFYHLLPELTALENVLAPTMIGRSIFGYLAQRRRLAAEARTLLERVGLAARWQHKPRELSGGESQRAAIARALITRPRVLLADEPTGNLDARNGQEILRLLRELQQERELTVVMVTHDLNIARNADRAVRLVEGRIADA